MDIGNMAIIEAGIDKLDPAGKLELAAQLIASASIHDESASLREMLDDVADQAEQLTQLDGLMLGSLL